MREINSAPCHVHAVSFTQGPVLQVGDYHDWEPLTPTQVTNCCWALAYARHCSPALHGILRSSGQPDFVSSLKPQQMATLLWSCSVLLHQPVAFLDTAAQHYSLHTAGADCVWHLLRSHAISCSYCFLQKLSLTEHACRCLDSVVLQTSLRCTPGAPCCAWRICDCTE